MQNRRLVTLAIAAAFAAPILARPQSGVSRTSGELRPRLRGPLFSPVQLYGRQDTDFADLDGDGRLEVISLRGGIGAGLPGSGVGISKLRPDMEVESVQILSTNNPTGLAIADFDGDQDLDLAVANAGFIPGEIDVFRNRGDGTFVPSGTYTFPSGSKVVAAGDWDGDGDTDLVNVQASDGLLGIYANDGSGAFVGPLLMNVGPGLAGSEVLIVHDLDGDGRRDLVTMNASGPAVVRAQSEGFAQAVRYSVPSTSTDMVLADVNGDSRIDIVLTTFMSIRVLPGNGDGTFGAVHMSPVAVPLSLETFDVADLDQNGTLDLVAGYEPFGGLLWFDGDGRGGFTERRRSVNPFSVFDVRAADLDGDRRPELLVGLLGSITLVPGDVAPGREFGRGYPLGPSIPTLQTDLVDMDGNGHPDAVMGGGNASGTVAIVFDDGRGDFGSELETSLPSYVEGLQTGDFDGDGDRDVAAYSRSDVVSVLENDGFGRLGAPSELAGGTDPVRLAVGDLDGDGHEDLALTNPSVLQANLLFNDGAGGFTAASAVSLSAPADPRWIAAGDRDRDGDLDLVFTETALDRVRWLVNDGTGGFSSGGTSPVGDGPAFLLASDLEQDGDLDLAVVDELSDTVSVLRGDGSGAFAPREILEVTAPTHLAVGDVDGDAFPDLLATFEGGTTLNSHPGFVLFCGSHAGDSYLPPSGHGLLGTPQAARLADMEGDGDLDLVLCPQFGSIGYVGMCRNRARGAR